MIRHAILLTGALALLVACGTPQEQCITRETRDLRVLDRLITGTEGNIARGYAFEEVTVTDTRYVLCRPGDEEAKPVYCWRDFTRTERRPKAIDIDAERQKLQSMRVKRDELARAAAPAIAACRAAYPE